MPTYSISNVQYFITLCEKKTIKSNIEKQLYEIRVLCINSRNRFISQLQTYLVRSYMFQRRPDHRSINGIFVFEKVDIKVQC